MEMAFINAILRSPTFPPNDPWLSGYSISYYYFGYVMVAMLTRLGSIEPGVAFNLAGSSWFALTALAAYGLTYSLLTAFSRQAAGVGRAIGARGWALLAPFFLLIVSNLEGFLEVLHARGIFWTQAADGTWQSGFWRWLNMKEICQPPTPPFSWVPERPAGIWWWRASRVIQDFDMGHVARIANGEQCVTGREVIDEFPFFSYFLADLHPHVLAMPFALLAVGLALNLYLQSRRSPVEGAGFFSGLRSWLAGERMDWSQLAVGQWLRRIDFWLAAVALGGLAFLNTWDFPIYVALLSAAYVLARYQTDGWNSRRVGEFIETGVLFGLAGIFLYLPFYIGFSSQAGGLLPSLSFFTRGAYFWIMFGSLLVPILAWLAWSWSKRGGRAELRTGLIFAAALVGGLWAASYLFSWIALSLSGIGQALMQGGSSTGMQLVNIGSLFAGLQYGEAAQVYANNPYAVLWNSFGRRLTAPGAWITLFAVVAVVWGLLAGTSRCFYAHKAAGREIDVEEPGLTANAFVMLLVLVGAGLVLVPEFVYLRDQFGDRMNTIFKFYFQVWILWSIAAAYATGLLWQAMVSSWRHVFRVVVVLVLLMGLAYPFFNLSMRFERLNPANLTLDGTAHIERYNPDEMAAIRFLRQAPLGVVAEAVGGQYSSYARIATNTGQPNVLGWPGHQVQWRGGSEEIGSRQPDIERLYQTPNWDEAQAIIQQYRIRYIYVGSLEHSSYRVNETKFQNFLKPVFQQGEVVIYETPDYNVAATGLGR